MLCISFKQQDFIRTSQLIWVTTHLQQFCCRKIGHVQHLHTKQQDPYMWSMGLQFGTPHVAYATSQKLDLITHSVPSHVVSAERWPPPPLF